MKVVINACYGGFSLSPEAVKWMAEKRGVPCHFYVENLEDEDGNYLPYGDAKRKYKKVTTNKVKDSFIWNATTIKTAKEYNKFMSFDWGAANTEEKAARNEQHKKVHHDFRIIKRHDELLVEMVETLGSDKASGSCAKLKVLEIPITVYIVDDYDGFESVSEPHQTWS